MIGLGTAGSGSVARRVREVLGSRDYRVLLAARLASQAAEGAFLASVFNTVVFLPESQSTVRGFALATAVTLLPFSLLEPVAGVFVDRWPRRPILVTLAVARAAIALLALPAVGALAAVYAGTLLVFSANRLFQATATAVIPRVVAGGAGGRGDDAAETAGDAVLFIANTVAAVAGTVALFGGMFLGGVLASAAGTQATVALAAGSWGLAALASARLSNPLPPQHPAVPLGSALIAVVVDLGDGFRRIARTPAALAPILTVAAGQFLNVVVIAAVLVVIKTTLGGGMLSFSGLVGAGGVGVFLGFATAGVLRSRLSNQLLIGFAFVVAALAMLPAFVAGSALTLTIGAVMLGASYGWTRVPVDTLAQRAVPDRYRGRVFTAIDLGFNTARVLGAVAAVGAVPLLGPRTTCAVAALLFLLWAPVVPLWLRERHR